MRGDEVTDRRPLSNSRVEAAVVGSLLNFIKGFERIDEQVPELTGEMFENQTYGRAFDVLYGLYQDGVREVTAKEVSGRAGCSLAALNDAAGIELALHDLVHDARMVVELAQRRRLRDAATHIAASAEDLSTPCEHVLAEAGSSMDAFFSGDQADRDMYPAGPVFSEVLTMLNEERTHSKRLPSGFDALDEMLQGGYKDGTLNVIAARPGCGKTALGMQIIDHVVPNTHGPVAVFSLELSRHELIERMLWRLLGGRFFVPPMPEPDAKALRNFSTNYMRWVTTGDNARQMVFISDNPMTSNRPSLMRMQLNRLQRHEGAIGMILVDYLQLMNGDRQGKNITRALELAEVSRALKDIAKEFRCPVIALAQLNRNIEHRGENESPRNSDLRDSGAIEQDADTIMFMYPTKKAEGDGAGRDIRFELTKNRAGPIGVIGGENAQFTFNGPIFSFETKPHTQAEQSDGGVHVYGGHGGYGGYSGVTG